MNRLWGIGILTFFCHLLRPSLFRFRSRSARSQLVWDDSQGFGLQMSRRTLIELAIIRLLDTNYQLVLTFSYIFKFATVLRYFDLPIFCTPSTGSRSDLSTALS